MGKICKILVCGSKKVGKTSLLEQLIYSRCDLTNYVPSIEDIYAIHLEKDIEARFYDTAGIDEANFEANQLFEAIKHLLYVIDAVVLVYNVNQKDTFTNVQHLMQMIDQIRPKKEPYMFMLVGTHIDEDKENTTHNAAKTWSQKEKNIVMWTELSVTDRPSLIDAFVSFVREILMSQVTPTADASGFKSFKEKAGRLLQLVLRKQNDVPHAHSYTPGSNFNDSHDWSSSTF